MITLFENFNKELPFQYEEYMIFYYDKQRFDFKNILVYIEDEPVYTDIGVTEDGQPVLPYNGKGVYSAIGRRIIANSNSNILLNIKYNKGDETYTDILSYQMKLLWRGFDKNEAINNINTLNNTEKFNV